MEIERQRQKCSLSFFLQLTQKGNWWERSQGLRDFGERPLRIKRGGDHDGSKEVIKKEEVTMMDRWIMKMLKIMMKGRSV